MKSSIHHRKHILGASSLLALMMGSALSLPTYAETHATENATSTVMTHKNAKDPWWKDAVFYQIYPRSFKDSNGDGIGDFNGIIEKLDYLKALGINGIWINPHYESPNKDNGYDISNYREVMKQFGTMADFDRLVAEMKKRDMRLMIDIVVNHTSDQHHWFQESRKSKDNPYRDYYIWRDGKGQNGDQPPNNYLSLFGGSAWQRDPATQQYFLHYFGTFQPDLNWDNPKVRQEVYDMLRFWLKKGVSGLRFDTVATLSKNEKFPDLTADQLNNFSYQYTLGPNLHKYIKEMNREVLSKYDIMTSGEIFGVPLKDSILFSDSRRHELDSTFSFDVIRFDRQDTVHRWVAQPWTLSQLRQANDKRDEVIGQYGWNTYFLANHDNPRAVSHYGDDRPEWRAVSAKALATMALTQRATPFIYQGDELGMTNYPFKSIDEFDDIEAKGFYDDFVKTGKVPADQFLKEVTQTSRDNARTPFQWSDGANAGFTTGKPWFVVNPNYKEINATAEMKDPDSVFNYYRKLIKVRQETQALATGTYKDLDPSNNTVYAYTRTLHNQRYLVAVNFTEKDVHYALPDNISVKRTLISNYDHKDPSTGAKTLYLAPWQAGIYQIN